MKISRRIANFYPTASIQTLHATVVIVSFRQLEKPSRVPSFTPDSMRSTRYSIPQYGARSMGIPYELISGNNPDGSYVFQSSCKIMIFPAHT